jgi:protein subunit release factor B
MFEKIKDYWQWIVGGLLAIIAIAASKKRDSETIIKVGDSEIEKKRSEKIIAAQEDLYEQHSEKRNAAQEEHARKSEEIAKIKSARQKELENNPDELDRILKEKYKLKGE